MDIEIFGSTVRGTATESSDIDLLVDLDPGRTLLESGRTVDGCPGCAGVRVDVALERMLRPDVRWGVVEEAAPL